MLLLFVAGRQVDADREGSAGHYPPRASARVLVVEDEVDIRQVISWLLAESGYSVEEAENGKEAQQALLHGPVEVPDVILLDLLMPVMDGEEFLVWKELQSNPKLKNIPVIVVTGVSEIPASVRKSAALILRKPVEIARLEDAIARCIAAKEA